MIAGTKFQLKLTILIFWTKSAQGYFRSKTENLHFCVCPCSLYTILNFSIKQCYRGRQTQHHLNVSSPSIVAETISENLK